MTCLLSLSMTICALAIHGRLRPRKVDRGEYSLIQIEQSHLNINRLKLAVKSITFKVLLASQISLRAKLFTITRCQKPRVKSSFQFILDLKRQGDTFFNSPRVVGSTYTSWLIASNGPGYDSVLDGLVLRQRPAPKSNRKLAEARLDGEQN